jgi:membrane-associated protein
MDHIVHLVAQYKYLLLFPLSIVEGPAITVIAGFLCAGGYMNPFIALPVISTGDVIGDSIYYSLGRLGKPLFLKKERLSRVRVYFQAHPRRTISLSKVILGVGVAGLYIAGNARVPYARFLAICLVTSLIQASIYLGIGFGFGQAYVQINRYLNETAAWIVVITLCLFLGYGIRTMTRKL